MEEVKKEQFVLYPTVTEYLYFDDEGKVKKGKFNYMESVNSAYQKIKKQLEVQVEQALLQGIEGEE